MIIESLKNDKIKHLLKLTNKNAFRKKEGVFIVEGQQENDLAIKFGHASLEYFICEEIFDSTLPDGKTHFVNKNIYDKIAYRGTTEGIIGVYNAKKTTLNNFEVKENTSIIILESIEKPGNLGAIIRSCEAFGIDAIIIADAKIDVYNPNVIRSSVGCVFGMPIFSESKENVNAFLTENDIHLYTTIMSEDAKMLDKITLQNKTAIAFGTEHSGLSDFWINKGQNTLIPMCGKIDSLNLSNAVAISCYEILRQKRA